MRIVKSLPAAVGFLLILSTPVVPGAETPPPQTSAPSARSLQLTAQARILAGLPAEGGEPWASIQAQPAWKAHSKSLGRLWALHEKERLSKVRAWSTAHLGALRGASTNVFYPFSGPDTLYPLALFPEAPVYLLVGLENVGLPPDVESLKEKELDKSLGEMRESLSIILQVSFFRTNDMALELKDTGVVPILMVLLAGTGNRILDIRPVALNAEGSTSAATWAGRPNAVRIDFANGEAGPPQTLYYVRQDLSDAGLKKASAFPAFVEKLGGPVTFLKAASYLMHEGWFSTIRKMILDRSCAVLEDDAGIPLKGFDAGRWDVRLYGTYTGPVKKFHEFLQPDLVKAYQTRSPESLDFGIGYQHHAGKSNLLLAAKKKD